jgi:hypothetical protein
MTSFGKALGCLAVLWTSLAIAGDGEWELVQSGAITIKARQRSGTAIREIWAEGVINAPVQDIQATMMEPDRFRHFMPYVKEARQIGPVEPDGTRFVYTRIEPPIVSSRDYVVKVTLVESVAADGTGSFRNKWVSAHDRLPTRHNIVRLKVNDGGWVITPRGDGSTSYAVYKFAVDPGGWIPAFAADMGNKSGVADTFKNTEKEAQRRHRERLSQQGQAKAASGSPPGVVSSGP